MNIISASAPKYMGGLSSHLCKCWLHPWRGWAAAAAGWKQPLSPSSACDAVSVHLTPLREEAGPSLSQYSLRLEMLNLDWRGKKGR